MPGETVHARRDKDDVRYDAGVLEDGGGFYEWESESRECQDVRGSLFSLTFSVVFDDVDANAAQHSRASQLSWACLGRRYVVSLFLRLFPHAIWY